MILVTNITWRVEYRWEIFEFFPHYFFHQIFFENLCSAISELTSKLVMLRGY